MSEILSLPGRLLEVILFIENEPMSKTDLSKMTGLDDTILQEALNELTEHWNKGKHGLELVESNDTYRFIPASDLHERLRDCYGKKVDRRLSKAALETLSIIAYAQPVTRRDIENIRGVSSDTIVRLLRDREYVKVIGHKDVPGRPGLYGTTKKFLYEFNLPSIAALPKLSEIDRARFTNEEESPNAN